MSLNIEIKNKIEHYINREKIALFIKGTQNEPKCGFSAKIIKILDNYVSDYMSIDVLQNQEIRQGIKEYSKWPTIPQLYVDQKFIGGSDILVEMHKNGDLFNLFNIEKINRSITIKITSAAKYEFQNATKFIKNNKILRLKINACFKHTLSLCNKNNNDLTIKNNGIKLIIDPVSQTRANKIEIDYKEFEDKKGFKINNPNAPPRVKQINVFEIKKKLNKNEQLTIFDVRTIEEWNIVHIKNTYLLRNYSLDKLKKLKKSTPIAFLCHHGLRSQRIAENFRTKGFTNIFNIIGGINAWANEIDKKLIKY